MVISMAMVATAVPKTPPTSRPPAPSSPAWLPSQWLAKSAIPMEIAVTKVVSNPTAVPEMMLVAGPVFEASAISRTGRYEPAV